MDARRTDGLIRGLLRRLRTALRGTGTAVARNAPRGRTATAALAVVCVPALSASGYLGWQVHQAHQEGERDQRILAAARQSAVNFTSLDYRHYERDSRNVLQGATGDFKKQFAAQTRELTRLVADNESVSQGQVLEAGIVRADDDSARVLVVADSEVTNVNSPRGQARTYRLQLDLLREDGRWLTSGVEFVG